jgi:hypothetical protein
MMRLLALIVVILAVCVGLVTVARAAGRTAPISPTYLEPGPCEQPCWQGVEPGVHTREEITERIRTASPYSGRTTDRGDGVVTMFELYTYGALTLADIVRTLGPPDRVGCLGLEHTALYPDRTVAVAVRVYYAEGLIMVDAVRPDLRPHLTPDMQIRSIRYYAPGEPTYPIGETTGWFGFGSHVRYLVCH